VFEILFVWNWDDGVRLTREMAVGEA
jgi:hypothetical protein